MVRTHSTAATPEPALPDADRARQIRNMLQQQLRALAVPTQEPPSTALAAPAAPAWRHGQGERLGDYLLAIGLIVERDLGAALAEQQQRIAQGRPIALGDLLVEQGHLTAHDLVAVLMLQQLDRLQESRAGSESRIGELLVQTGLITADQLAAALIIQTEARQRGEPGRLGRILIASGALTRQELAATLAQQRRSRRRAGG
jgi:hypothetical protein